MKATDFVITCDFFRASMKSDIFSSISAAKVSTANELPYSQKTKSCSHGPSCFTNNVYVGVALGKSLFAYCVLKWFS